MQDSLSFYEKSPNLSTVSIISVPTELGSDARGLSQAPNYLRLHGLVDMLASLGVDVSEETTIPCETPKHGTEVLKNLTAAADVANKTAHAVEVAVKQGEVALVLGGDHSVAIGSIRGASAIHGTLGVIWIDAHPDAHTHETTLTRNIHGMPAALAMGFGHDKLLGHDRQDVAPNHFVYVGLKDFDEAELQFLRRESPQLFTLLDIARRGLSPVFNAIEELSRKVDRVWVSMDMDAIDAQFAPGVAMQNSGGLTAREILSIAHFIGKTCNVAGLDMVEVLPSNDHGGKTAKLAVELVARFLGQEYGGYNDYIANYTTKQKVVL